MAIFADRADITEEIVRLRAHLDGFLGKMSAPQEEDLGKYLEFLGQEMLRETNTIGSKTRHTKVNSLVVHMKRSIKKFASS